MLKIQSNLAKTLDIYTRICKSVEVPTAATAAAAIGQFASISQKQMSGLNAIDSFYQSFQPHSAWRKVLDNYYMSTKPLMTTTRYWETVRKNLGLQSSFFTMPQPTINDNLVKVLERLASVTSMPDVSSLQRLASGIESVNEDLYGLMNQAYYEDDDIEDFELEEGFTSNAEIQEALEEQVNDPVKFQEKVAFWTEKKKRQFFIVYIILNFFWGNFIQPYFQECIGAPVMAWTVAHVKELPEKAGKFIGDLKEDIEATIIENVPYYYKVTFIDENGEVKEGYVSKRSVKLVEPVIETEEAEKQETTAE